MHQYIDKITNRYLSLHFSDLGTFTQELIAQRIAKLTSYKLSREEEDEFDSYVEYVLNTLYDTDEIICDINIQEIAEDSGILK